MKNKNTPVIYAVCGKNPLVPRSGYASYSFNLIKNLIKLGYRVKIFSFKKTVSMSWLLILAPKIVLDILKELKNDKRVIIWGIGPWSLAGAIAKLLKREKVILFSDYFTTIQHEYQGTVSAISIKDYGVIAKLKVLTASLTVIKLYTVLERFLLDISDSIITHYLSAEKILSEQFGIKKERFKRLPYTIGIENSKNTETGQTRVLKKPTIITIARQDGRKGINFLLYSYYLLNKRGLKYSAVIIGDGEFLNSNVEIAKKLNLKNIAFKGTIDNTMFFLKNADLFVLPSVEEGSSSLAILEAMKEGIPIISTNVDGIGEDLQNGKSALLVPPKNPQALADAIKKLLENSQLAEKLRKKAKEDYNKKHDSNLTKREIAKLIQRFTN